jgi:hypothetical protein
MGPLWSGVKREHVEPAPAAAIVDPVVEEAEEQPAVVEAAQPATPDVPATIEVSVTPAVSAPPRDPDADLQLMFGGELVRVIVGAGGDGPRAARAFDLLAQRGNADYLLDDLELLCRSRLPEQQLRALQVIDNLQPPADESYRRQARELLLRMVGQHNEPAVVEASLRALDVMGGASG